MRLQGPTRLALVLLLGAAGCRLGYAAPADSAPALTTPGPLVGDPAPAFEVEHWLKGEPLQGLPPGPVYVIDIWATWCGPCIGGMEHLSELQERYGRDVVVIGLVSEDSYGSTLEKARAVVAREANRIRYRIAWDHGRSTYLRWMARESGAGWPWCFVVDRRGDIAWTGHPARLDAVLDQVVTGTWNGDSARTAYRRRALGMQLGDAFYAAYRANRDSDAAVRYAALRGFDPTLAATYAPHYFKLLLLREQRRAEAYRFAREAMASMLRERPEELDRIAAMACDSTTPPPLRDLDVALECATQAVHASAAPGAGPHEALARVHASRGEWPEAIAAQSRAIAASDSAALAARRDVLARYRAHRR